MNESTFPITGMTCGNCAAKVRERLAAHPDVQAAEISVDPPQATLKSTRGLSASEVDQWLAPLGKYHATQQASAAPMPEKSATTYKPLLILAGYLIAINFASFVARGGWDWMFAMRIFMGTFFIAFSFFKMLDLRGFADAYRGYDLVAKAIPPYAFVYPFIELALGLAYLAHLHPVIVNAVTAVVMAASLAGVLRAVLSKRAIRCACLGTVFQLPMSTVTIIEDGLMLAMAVAMLFFH